MGRYRENSELVLGFSRRFGGVSSGAYESLNLAYHVGDDPKYVAKNRQILLDSLGFGRAKFMNQVHGDEIFIVRDDTCDENTSGENSLAENISGEKYMAENMRTKCSGASNTFGEDNGLNLENNMLNARNLTGECEFKKDNLKCSKNSVSSDENVDNKNEKCRFDMKMRNDHNAKSDFDENLPAGGGFCFDITPTCDALITDQRGILLCVMVADCSPILIFDKKKRVISAIHAGRVGVMKRILSKTIGKMGEIYGSKASDLRVIVGPNIKVGCYEIGDLELGEFGKFAKFIDNRRHFDLNSAIKNELKELRVGDFCFSEICTHCSDEFFSYRRSGVTGRFVGYIGLR